MGTKLDKAIGERLKHFRKSAGYTQEQLAELVKMVKAEFH